VVSRKIADTAPAVKAVLAYCEDCFGIDGRSGRCANRECPLYRLHLTRRINLARAIRQECRNCWGADPRGCTTLTCPLYHIREGLWNSSAPRRNTPKKAPSRP
jgi:hypothetical protein